MTKHFKKRIALIFICLTGIISMAYSQSIYEIENTQDINMTLLGTSTLHDWEMDAKSATGEAQFVFESGSESDLASLESLSLAIEVEDLKSNNKGLDKNAYKALKSDEFKDIQYILTSSSLSPEQGGYLLKTNGNLTIAGVTKEIDMDVHCVVNENATITCQGTNELNMTDYNVEPPSFMLGVMKTGDAITMDFTVVYKK